MLNNPPDAALDEARLPSVHARKEAADAIMAAFAESETFLSGLSDQTAARVVKALERYFHIEGRVLGEAGSSEEDPKLEEDPKDVSR